MMSEPLELKEQTPYAIDRLDTLKAAIMHSIQEMVIHRAKVEKYRKSDLPTARSAYETLEYFRKQLAEQLMESQLILLETEAYKLASMAGQLHQGVSGFNLMSTGYKPIYEVLNKFTSAFPTGQKTNAAVIGRLMNNIKLGYAYVRGVRPELTPGTQLSHVRLTTRKQDTVVFCVLESYEVYQQGQQAA